MLKQFDYEKYYPIFALWLMIILGIFLLYSLAMFINPVLGAGILFILTRPLMIWFTEKKKWNNTLSTILSMVISFVVFMLLIGGIFYLVIGRVTELLSNPDEMFAIFDKLHLYVNEKLKFEILSPDTVITIKSTMASVATSLLNQTFTIASDVAIMYFILYFMLASRKSMEETILFYLPYKKENIVIFKDELRAQTYSNAIVTPLLALIQGLTASLGYWIFGVDEPFFWGLMTGVFSFMPIVGSMIIWVPLATYMLAMGQNWNGIAVIVFSVFVTSSVDNVFRLLLQKKFADVHPLITLMGFLMGIKYFGVTGIIIGPVLMSFFLIMMKNFRTEFMTPSSET